MLGQFKKYRLVALGFLSLILQNEVLVSQTPANTVITNQAKATYKFKSFPTDTVFSAQTQFIVNSAPNFELHFSVRDTNVFGKETVLVRLVYKNVGNLKADSAAVEATLPLAGLKFVPASTQGAISNGTVTWVVRNVDPGKTDSVGVKMVVDSTLTAGTQLEVNSTITWQSFSITASKTFVISTFPRLELSLTPSAMFVGSGRTITYQFTVKNSGNLQSTNTTLVDTISQYGTFLSANVTPDSVKAAQKVVVWKLGNIAAFSERIISVTVQAQPNLGHETLTNSAVVYSNNSPNGKKSKVDVPILPVTPKSISLSAEPVYIWGKLNQDSSRIQAIVRDSSNQPLPDGVPVQFTTTRGSFSNNAKVIATTLQNGVATAVLRSEDVENTIQRATVIATGGVPISGTVSDSSYVFMYPGAVTGKVVNGLDKQPLQGAIARVYNVSKTIVGADTTGNDGKFFIPLNKDVTLYTLEIFVLDKFGDSVSTSATIDPTIFPIPPIIIPNTISGRIVYKGSGLPVPVEGITVFLDSASSGSGLTMRGTRKPKVSLPIGFGQLSRVQTQITDRLGRFKFENLKPAQYVVSVDSIQFPSYKGYNFISDTVSGTFTINLAIEIEQDSSITLAISRTQPTQTANAGDTLQYVIFTSNDGNYTHYNVSLTDTLSPFFNFVTAEQGIFKSVQYDTTSRIVRWQKDSLRYGEKDSLLLRVALTRNIPDSTNIRNAVWFASNVLTNLNSVTNTIVRSSAQIQFGNLFARDSATAGDSVARNIWFSNTGTDSIKGIRIIDTIYSAGKSLTRVDTNYTATIIDSIITINVGNIAPGKADTIALSMLTDFSLNTGTIITSSAHLIHNDSSLFNVKATLRMAENPNISSFLKIVKTANKKVAEIGDIVTYQIQISNTSPTYLDSMKVFDFVPYAFKYVKNSARYNGKPLEPVFNQNQNSLVWSANDRLLSNNNAMLVYQLAIGADGMESEGTNTAYASAVASVGTILTSAASQWQVTVRPGVFTEKGLIIGKVFYDDNRNAYQEVGETGIKDVELWMEDGTKIITGDDGKFSLPEVKPGQHVLRINEHTLPKGAELLGGNTKFANDPSSQFVHVTESGIAKANFFVKRHVQDSIRRSIGKVNKLLSARQAVPKYLYSDSLNNARIDTVNMVVSFTLSCGKSIQSIEINESLPAELTVVPGSGSFNGRRINPLTVGANIQWKIGRSPEFIQGVLKYKAVVKNMPKNNTVLFTISSVKAITSDSVVIESKKMVTENVVRNERKNRIETSDVVDARVNPVQMSDSVTVGVGDEVFFKTTLYIDPKKKIKSVWLIDSLESEFVINERTFAVNGVPLPSKNLSVRVKTSSLMASTVVEKNEVEFLRILSANLTDLLRKGINEITYSARINYVEKDTLYKNTTYASVVNEFNETSLISSKEVNIHLRSSVKPISVILETTFVDVNRPLISLESKVEEAVRLVESLKRNNSSTIVMEGITFEPGSTMLTKEAMIVLDNVAAILKEESGLKLQISGHTDNTGNANINRKMSLARAQAVREYLVKKGIEGSRLFAQGFGSDKPIASNKTEEGRAKNRRVEFTKRK